MFHIMQRVFIVCDFSCMNQELQDKQLNTKMLSWQSIYQEFEKAYLTRVVWFSALATFRQWPNLPKNVHVKSVPKCLKNYYLANFTKLTVKILDNPLQIIPITIPWVHNRGFEKEILGVHGIHKSEVMYPKSLIKIFLVSVCWCRDPWRSILILEVRQA